MKLPSGEPLFTLLMESEPVDDPAPGNSSRAASSASAKTDARGGDGDARMTEPQKRYLFRLLGAQGIEGKQAEAHLKDRFKVATLKDVTKVAASDYINQLVDGRKEAHGS